jgi:hypothetical protein
MIAAQCSPLHQTAIEVTARAAAIHLIPKYANANPHSIALQDLPVSIVFGVPVFIGHIEAMMDRTLGDIVLLADLAQAKRDGRPHRHTGPGCSCCFDSRAFFTALPLEGIAKGSPHNRVGAVVQWTTCGLQKKPRGRSGPLMTHYCEPRHNDEDYGGCVGYEQDPQAGSLWPGESCADFGYGHSHDGTEPGPIPSWFDDHAQRDPPIIVPPFVIDLA